MTAKTKAAAVLKTAAPLILEIKGNSLDDGPGIRSVVFFKGCPLDCVWCHNPESKRASIELSHDGNTCIACGACIKACQEKAITKKKKGFINRSRCTLCFECIDVCPSGALSRVGSQMPLPDVISRLLADKPFYDTSGGGVTLSGGEPTIAMEYISELAAALKKEGVPVLLETCGLFDINIFLDRVYPHLDEIYFDIKIFDDAEHKKYCGASNKKILENFSILQERFLDGGVPILARTPLIPGITDGAANLEAIASFLKEKKVSRTSLLAYNPLWHEKNSKIGVENPYSKKKTMKTFMKEVEIERCRQIFRNADIDIE